MTAHLGLDPSPAYFKGRPDHLVAPVGLAISAILVALIFVAEVPGAAFGLAIMLVGGGVIFAHPVAGVHVLFALVMLVEQFDFNERIQAWTAKIPIYVYILGEGAPLTAMDLLVGVIFVAIMFERMRAGSDGQRWKVGPVWVGVIALAIACVLAWVHGASRPGFESWVTVWELRALGYTAAATGLGYLLLRERRHVRAMMWIFAVVMVIKSLQAIHRLAIATVQNWPAKDSRILTAHEDAIFFSLFLVMAVGAIAIRSGRLARLEVTMLATAPIVIGGFIASNRRIAYVAVALAAMSVFVVLPKQGRRRVALIVAPVLMLTAVYIPAFWGSPTTVARPAQAVKAIVDPSGTDKESSLYREWEQIDVMSTLRPKLLTGIGFGHPYDQPIPLPELDSELQPFIPHNEILWFWLKAGSVGFLALWTWFGAIFMTGAWVMKRHVDPVFRLAGLAAAAMVPLQIAATWADLQLTFTRNMVLIGLLAGVAARAQREMQRDPTLTLDEAPPKLRRKKVRVGASS